MITAIRDITLAYLLPVRLAGFLKDGVALFGDAGFGEANLEKYGFGLRVDQQRGAKPGLLGLASCWKRRRLKDGRSELLDPPEMRGDLVVGFYNHRRGLRGERLERGGIPEGLDKRAGPLAARAAAIVGRKDHEGENIYPTQV